MEQHNTFAFYLQLRQSNPPLYYSSATQKEMHDSYIALGKNYFNSDEVAHG